MSRRSNSATFMPAWARYAAQVRPLWPAPTKAASSSGAAGFMGASLPLPGGCVYIQELYGKTVPGAQAMSASNLTPRQTEILRLIQRSVQETGMPPTRQEIANELGFRSANAAEEHLRALARKGVIALLPGASRGIQLKDTLREQVGLPLIGRVAAGSPILAEQNIEDHLSIDPSVFHPLPHYLLKVVGMSMKDAGILDGDLVAVHRTPNVRNRQIIVARLENEVTVKRYRQEGPIAWLLPENEDFEPIKVDLKQQSLLIEGVVVGVVRRGKGLGL
jgi:repressor LexA